MDALNWMPIYSFCLVTLALVFTKQLLDKLIYMRYSGQLGTRRPPMFHKHQLLLYVSETKPKILVFHVHDVKWFDGEGYRYAGYAYEKTATAEPEPYMIDSLSFFTTVTGVPEGRLMVPGKGEIGFLAHSVYSKKP